MKVVEKSGREKPAIEKTKSDIMIALKSKK